MLYFRMLLLMLISFYTSRVVLNALGVEDYGVYNVVGGLVGFMSFINTSLSLATNRFLSFAIGKNDVSLLNRTFNMSCEIHFAISIIVVILGETVGLWFFNNYLNLADTAYSAAMIVYQFSIASCFLGINMVPLTALVISHENMDVYAYFSILEGFVKLGVALLLTVIAYNKLEIFAALSFGGTVLIFLCWRILTKRKYKNVKHKLIWDRDLFRELYRFIGWQFIGAFSWLLRNQGVTLVLNFFYGPVLNTARTIAIQVQAGVSSLVSNFQTAVNPQLVKNFAKDERDEMQTLLFRSSKLSFILLFILTVPVLVTTESLLTLWLKFTPAYSVVFVQLMIIATLVDTMGGTLTQSIVASGKIKLFTIATASLRASEILIVFIFFKFGYPPQTLMYVEIALFLSEFIAKLVIAHQVIGMKIRQFLRHVTSYEVGMSVTIGATFFIIHRLHLSDIPLFPFLVVIFLIALVISWFIGLTRNERFWISNSIKNRLQRKNGFIKRRD